MAGREDLPAFVAPRRTFLMLPAVVAISAIPVGAAAQPRESAPQAGGYRESDHVRAAYARMRF